MVPSASTISSRLMPMPLSSTVEALVVRIERDGDARLRVLAEELRLGDRLVAQLLAGIGGVGDQLAQEDVACPNRPNAPSGGAGARHRPRRSWFRWLSYPSSLRTSHPSLQVLPAAVPF